MSVQYVQMHYNSAVCVCAVCIGDLWEHPTSLLAAPNSTSFGRTAALLVAPAKHQRSAIGGPSCHRVVGSGAVRTVI